MSGRSLAQDIQEFGLGDVLHFRADDANLTVQSGGIGYSCDGEQTVDVLCAGDKRAIAFEAKLGEKRMGVAEFRNRYCGECVESGHADCRISGSMVAVLERSLPFGGACDLVAEVDEKQWDVAPTWWLVLRQTILTRWLKNGSYPVTSARLISFDALAQLYGSRQQFDQLVQRVVGSDFAGRWGIALNDP